MSVLVPCQILLKPGRRLVTFTMLKQYVAVQMCNFLQPDRAFVGVSETRSSLREHANGYSWGLATPWEQSSGELNSSLCVHSGLSVVNQVPRPESY